MFDATFYELVIVEQTDSRVLISIGGKLLCKYKYIYIAMNLEISVK